MAAPERFAETSDSSCTAGAVHTWHLETCSLTQTTSVYRGRPEVIDGGPNRRDWPNTDIGGYSVVWQTLRHRGRLAFASGGAQAHRQQCPWKGRRILGCPDALSAKRS